MRDGGRSAVALLVACVAGLLVSLVLVLPADASTRARPASQRSVPTSVDALARTRTPEVLTDCRHRAIRPKGILFACGDGNFFIKAVTWRSWGRSIARGRGVLWRNDCVPYCAKGRFHQKRAYIHLSRVRGGLFNRVTLFYSVKGNPHHIEWLELPLRPL
jgi:hypothetical protein